MGGATDLRREVVHILAEHRGVRAAYRYAACGCADQVVKEGDGAYVRPKGCGSRLCPRCSRRAGGKRAKRILGWLASVEHGDVWVMCLTQPVHAGESLKEARRRMAPKQRAFMRWLTARGMIGGLSCVHMKVSERVEGWHYHVHILAELPAGTMTKGAMLAKWRDLSPESHVNEEDNQCRLATVAGPAMAELREDAGDTDFWSEAPSQVAKAVQYPLRDIVQGVSGMRLGGDLARMRKYAEEAVVESRGWKLLCAWGRWRKPCPVPEPAAVEKDQDAGEGKGTPGAPTPLGTVGRVWRMARAGDEEARQALRGLERGCRNASDFARRLVKFVRAGLNESG